jgi:acetylornithine/succinyldiaminopimelate/putrescine aminotransferase
MRIAPPIIINEEEIQHACMLIKKTIKENEI